MSIEKMMKKHTYNIVQIKKESEILEVLQCFSHYFNLLRNNIELQNQMAKKYSAQAQFRVVLCEGEIAGFISFYANNQIDRVAYVSMIAVSEKFRRRGFGKILLENYENISKLKNMKKINLEVLLSNTAAINFYERYGFTCIESRNTTLLMSKDI